MRDLSQMSGADIVFGVFILGVCAFCGWVLLQQLYCWFKETDKEDRSGDAYGAVQVIGWIVMCVLSALGVDHLNEDGGYDWAGDAWLVLSLVAGIVMVEWRRKLDRRK